MALEGPEAEVNGQESDLKDPSQQDDKKPAFKKFVFGEEGTIEKKFIKVPSDYDVSELYKKLENDDSKLFKPKLVISITGGAQDFKLRPRLKRVFRKSLKKIADTESTWIITGGTNVGIMNYVGKKVKNTSSREHLIGIATWGVIIGREKLLENANNECPKYDIEDQEGTNTYLDENHSLFMLVDDGSKNEYGKEISLRAKFEREIADQTKANVVCVIVGGGPGSLRTVTEAIKNETPVVLVKGSGGYANILSSIIESKRVDVSEDELRRMLSAFRKMGSLSRLEQLMSSDWT